MSRTFDDSLAYDVEEVFFNVDEFAISVAISRGSSTTSSVPAIVSQGSNESFDDRGMPVLVVSSDFRIVARSYLINGKMVDPREGDRITDPDGMVYEVLPIAGKQCFDLDNGGKVLTVHTKQVK